jgi:hypothetical protein
MTLEDYEHAVVKLVALAQDSTGGARVAAQVLLSAYNGGSFQLDVVSLCNLDDNYFEAAQAVIVGRRAFHREPHQLIKDGDRIFSDLRKQWIRLHVDNRWKADCSECRGSGEVPVDPKDYDCENYVTCKSCKGRGW